VRKLRATATERRDEWKWKGQDEWKDNEQQPPQQEHNNQQVESGLRVERQWEQKQKQKKS